MNKLIMVGVLVLAFIAIGISAGGGIITTAKDVTVDFGAEKGSTCDYFKDVNYSLSCQGEVCAITLNKIDGNKSVFNNRVIKFSVAQTCLAYKPTTCIKEQPSYCEEYGEIKCKTEEEVPTTKCVEYEDTCLSWSEPVCTAEESRYVLGECIGWKEPECIEYEKDTCVPTDQIPCAVRTDLKCLKYSERTCNKTVPEVLVKTCLNYTTPVCLEYDAKAEPKCMKEETITETQCTEYETPVCEKEVASVCLEHSKPECVTMSNYSKDYFIQEALKRECEFLTKTISVVTAEQKGIVNPTK